MTVKVGDRVRINRPDGSGVSAVLAGYDCAFEVSRVDGRMVFVRPHLPLMPDEVFVYEQEVDVVDEPAWKGKQP